MSNLNSNPYLELLRTAQEKYRKNPSGASYTTTDRLADYGLGGVNCPECENRGHIVWQDEDGQIHSRECSCMTRRRALRRLRKSGLADSVQRCTFASYQTPDETRQTIKALAQRFAEDDGGWFYIAGRSGSGKTHICTAICGVLMQRRDVRYMLWRDWVTQLKANVTDAAAYAEIMQPLKDVPVLYIDDFLKGGVTRADLNAAFELLNARYLDSRKRTIISSERTLSDILDLDEALGGRIYERSRGYNLQAPGENWRLRPAPAAEAAV